MVKTSRALPDGIAIVRVQTGGGQITVWSNELSPSDALAARIAVAALTMFEGCAVVTMSELSRIVLDAA